MPDRARCYLILDTSDPDDPVWVLARTVNEGDSRPAVLGETGEYLDWRDTTRWIRAIRDEEEVMCTPLPSPKVWDIAKSPPHSGENDG